MSKLTSFNPRSVSPMDIQAPRTLEIDAAMSGVSFGRMQDLVNLPSVMLRAPSIDMPSQPVEDGVLISGGEPTSLSTVLSDGLLTDLVAVASSYPADATSQGVDWMHSEQALTVGETGARCGVR